MNRARADTITFRTMAVAVVCLWIAIGAHVAPTGRNQDFLNLYTGASLARQGRWAEMHDPAVQLAFERQITPERTVLVPFVRPHVYALALMPLSLLAHQSAFVVWICVQAGLLLACFTWARRRFGRAAMMWGLFFSSAAIGVMLGQDPGVLLAISLAGYALAERGKDRWAGFVWALGLVKFHLILGLIVALLVGRRWKMAQGFAAGAALIGGGGLLLGGMQGMRTYLAMLTTDRVEGVSPSPELMINLQALAANAGMTGWAFAAVAGLLAFAGFVAAQWDAPLWRWYSAAMVFGLLAVPHVYAYDGTLLLLPAWLAFYESQDRWTRLTAGLFAAPVLVFLNLAGKPWAAANSIALVLWLAALASLRFRKLHSEN